MDQTSEPVAKCFENRFLAALEGIAFPAEASSVDAI